MKKLFISICLLYCSTLCAQISVVTTDGSSVVTDLGYGIKVNKGSTLLRQSVTLNDAEAPIQLNKVSIETSYADHGYLFKPKGDFTVKEPIVAYEIHHVIYNVFGEHMKTLSNTQISDIEGLQVISPSSSWNASENNVREYFICISYVANARTKSGQIWHYNFPAIKEQLNKLKITFEEAYLPKKDSEKEK